MYITISPLFPHNPTLSAPERISTDALRARSLDLNPKNPEKPMELYFVVQSVCLQYVINCIQRLEIRYIDDIYIYNIYIYTAGRAISLPKCSIPFQSNCRELADWRNLRIRGAGCQFSDVSGDKVSIRYF